MKFVITGGAGHISKPLAEKLLANGHTVKVIGRNAANIKVLTDKGAEAAIGSVEDVNFLKETFAGADAVYSMVPPTLSATDWKSWIAQVGKNYAEAVKANGIKHVVLLSSIGAHLPEGCGPVTGLHRVEEIFSKLTDVHVKTLRPASFYTNLFANIGMIKNMGIVGANYGGPSLKVPMVHPTDIAEVAAEELLKLDFKGHSIRYITSDERTTDEIASVLGAAVGKPDLKWIVFSDEDALRGMIGAGLPEEIAKNYAEMNHSMQEGKMSEDYWKHRPASLQKIKLETFAKTFAAAYNNEAPVAAH